MGNLLSHYSQPFLHLNQHGPSFELLMSIILSMILEHPVCLSRFLRALYRPLHNEPQPDSLVAWSWIMILWSVALLATILKIMINCRLNWIIDTLKLDVRTERQRNQLSCNRAEHLFDQPFPFFVKLPFLSSTMTFIVRAVSICKSAWPYVSCLNCNNIFIQGVH